MKLSHDKLVAGTNLTIADFWQWAYSDILSNRNRAIFAEFLVGAALGVLDNIRVEWDSVDLRYRGKRIEVKSAAYVQSWAQSKPSKVIFDISQKLSWDAETNAYATERSRTADCYVFCLFSERDINKARETIMNVESWQFYVLSTEYINRTFAQKKAIALSRIQTGCEAISFHELKHCVDLALAQTGSVL